jgi:hypothetical protein
MIRKNPLLVKYLSYTIALLFAFIYAPFEFIEGDDAQTMMFHLSNYNFHKYQPYSTYHIGFDLFIYILNKLIGITYLNHVVFCLNIIVVYLNIFFIDVIFISRNSLNKIGVILFPIILILISPEWLFSSWVLGAPNFALFFSLIGIWIYFNWQKQGFLLSSFFFSVSIFFRFDFLYVFLFIFIYESIILEDFFMKKAKLFFIFQIVLLTAIFTIFIIIFGYSIVHKTDTNFENINTILSDVLNVFKLKIKWVEIAHNSHGGLKSAMGAIGFFTPLFFYTTIVGLYHQRKSPFLKLWLLWFCIIVCFSFCFGWYFTHSGTIKRMLFAVPFFILPTIHWIENLNLRSKDFLCALLILLFQFFVGLNVKTSTTAYGPNLSVNNFYGQLNSRKVEEKYFLALNSGFAFPTEEGIRPILGFGFSLFDWSRFYFERNRNYEVILTNLNYITLVDTRTALFDVILFKNGFIKKSVKEIMINNVLWEVQQFTNDKIGSKMIISIAGGSKTWRRDFNVKNIFNLKKNLNCELNFALVYSSTWVNNLQSDSILSISPFTGELLIKH